MKKLVSFALTAMIAIAFTSCKKSVQIVDPSLNYPMIFAKIHPTVNQPSDAVLGDASATFGVGDKVVVYVPYQIANDEITMADLVIKDDVGELQMIKQLQVSMDPVAEGLNVPVELQGTQFLVGTIEIDASFANKNFILSIEIRGANSGYSTDRIENAFVVLP
ncbi:MAG TPA: hypothetical protein VEV87_08330 [Chitinophagaceae bacterium]|nr:hypothetical protein [Chitinophagaceae bacterium]